jgi:plasmid stabilization system protein ParE
MEAYDVILSQDAENDLNSIFSYISDVLGSPINAMN